MIITAAQLHADLVKANRVLLAAMRTRDRLRRRLDEADHAFTAARKRTREIMAAAAIPAPPPIPVCDECQHILGTNRQCDVCNDARELTTSPNRENPADPKRG